MEEYSDFFGVVQERVPEETLLVYHTLHVPRHTSNPGMWEADAYLAQHVAQLNAAGRHVAQQLAYHVVDVEAMAAQMSQDTALIDNTHPGPDFMMQVRWFSRIHEDQVLDEDCMQRWAAGEPALQLCHVEVALLKHSY